MSTPPQNRQESAVEAIWPHLGVAEAGLFISCGEGTHPSRVIETYEIILVRSGVLKIRENGAVFTVGSGEFLILHPGRAHRGVEFYPKGLSFYWLHFYLKPPFFDALNLPQHAMSERPERMIELFRWYLDDQSNELLTSARAKSLILMILEEALLAPRENFTRTVIPLKVEEYVANNFSRSVQLADISRALGYSGDYISRQFRETRGISISEFVRNWRAREAASLLVETNLQLKEISNRCGYANAAHFTRTFKSETGMTPLAYRRLYLSAYINTH